MAKPYSPTAIYAAAMEADRLFTQELFKHLSAEEQQRFCLENGYVMPDPIKKPEPELWDADPNCDHDEQPASGGGVRCTKCKGWFCY